MISALGPSCAEGTQEKVDEVWAGIADGSLKVFDTSTFTVGGETVTEYEVNFSIIDFNTGTVIYEGPTENVISDGVFQESVYTAPRPTLTCASTASPSSTADPPDRSSLHTEGSNRAMGGPSPHCHTAEDLYPSASAGIHACPPGGRAKKG